MEDIRVRFTVKGPSGVISFSKKEEIHCNELLETLSMRLNEWEQHLRQTAANILIKGYTNSEIAASIDVVYSLKADES